MKVRVIKRTIMAPLVVLAFASAAIGGWYAVQATAAEQPMRAARVGLMETSADIKVYKSPTCGCCTAWVEHLEEHGLSVETVHVDQGQLNTVKQQAGLTRELASCHTAFIEGYAVEGHVPVGDIQRLIAEKPDISGLAVPGMPAGSPGMEVGGRHDPFDVVSFDQSGDTAVFSSYNQ